jgi:prephenate dehydratase
MNVAIQGFTASFHEIAAKRIFGEGIQLKYCRTFKEVFHELEEGRVDRVVVAIENSLYGSINEVYDLLLQHNFWICGEIYEHIGLHLMGPRSSNLQAVTDIYSMAPALGESEAYLDKNLPKAERHEHADTALAAKEVATWGDPTKAAIAGKRAADTYGLTILANNIETHHENYTRFIALSREPITSSNITKTSITFQTADTPGSLYAALGVFASRDINLSKLESRPIVGSAWHYMYYLDFEASFSEAIREELSKYATKIRILGSYAEGVLESI